MKSYIQSRSDIILGSGFWVSRRCLLARAEMPDLSTDISHRFKEILSKALVPTSKLKAASEKSNFQLFQMFTPRVKCSMFTKGQVNIISRVGILFLRLNVIWLMAFWAQILNFYYMISMKIFQANLFQFFCWQQIVNLRNLRRRGGNERCEKYVNMNNLCRDCLNQFIFLKPCLRRCFN